MEQNRRKECENLDLKKEIKRQILIKRLIDRLNTTSLKTLYQQQQTTDKNIPIKIANLKTERKKGAE